MAGWLEGRRARTESFRLISVKVSCNDFGQSYSVFRHGLHHEVIIKDKNWRRKLYTKEEQSRICEEARELYLEDNLQYEDILTQLAEFGRKPQKILLDGDCLFRAVMSQLKVSPQWTPMMFRKMTSYFMVKHWDVIV